MLQPSVLIVTPEQVRPYAKAASRKQSTRGKKHGSTKILKDTPVKQQIAAEEEARIRKRKKAARPKAVQ